MGKREKNQEERRKEKKRVRKMNNKCSALESIFKGRLEEAGCKQGMLI